MMMMMMMMIAEIPQHAYGCERQSTAINLLYARTQDE
jgi:hypothetical protein